MNQFEATMNQQLKSYFQSKLSFTTQEIGLIDDSFEIKEVNKGDYFLQSGSICQQIGFIQKGIIRHFHYKDGEEQTCDISLEQSWVTDYYSFNNGTPATINLQALETTTLQVINKEKVHRLYQASQTFESFGRMMAQEVAERATKIAMSLSSETPEERYHNLINNQSHLLQRVPQKYLAGLIGITPESFSRIRRRQIS